MKTIAALFSAIFVSASAMGVEQTILVCRAYESTASRFLVGKEVEVDTQKLSSSLKEYRGTGSELWKFGDSRELLVINRETGSFEYDNGLSRFSGGNMSAKGQCELRKKKLAL